MPIQQSSSVACGEDPCEMRCFKQKKMLREMNKLTGKKINKEDK
jgi:hypothetical protein